MTKGMIFLVHLLMEAISILEPLIILVQALPPLLRPKQLLLAELEAPFWKQMPPDEIPLNFNIHQVQLNSYSKV